MTLFELEALGGPWGRRLKQRRASVAGLPWGQIQEHTTAEGLEVARWVWTQSAFSEYASAASFASITTALLAAGAPVDLIAAAGDFVVDEIFHAELCARIVTALGGAIPLEVDLERLVRPVEASEALLRAAALLVRTSCVGETLTVPLLEAARRQAQPRAIRAVLRQIIKDESQHARLGFWFLDWAQDRLSDEDRATLSVVAGDALRSFAPVLSGDCQPGAKLGVLGCGDYEATFRTAVARRVVPPLRERGVVISADALGLLGVSLASP